MIKQFWPGNWNYMALYRTSYQFHYAHIDGTFCTTPSSLIINGRDEYTICRDENFIGLLSLVSIITGAFCQLWAGQGTRSCHQKKLRHFLAARRIVFVTTDILGVLLKTKSGSQQIIELKCQYTKIIKAMLVTIVSCTNATTFSVGTWFIPSKNPAQLLTGNRLQFACMSFAAFTVHLGFEQLTTTPYHAQNNGQVDLYK